MGSSPNNNKKYPSLGKLNLPEIEKEILSFWKEQKIFEKSIENRQNAEPWVFFEGPPSANGMPGIHHVMSRTIKDIFGRYMTLNGKLVERKGGWDTHGLPVELQVEKKLGITKEDIGTKISIEEYNNACREDVLKYKDVWDELTERIGFWLDLDKPYITYTNEYIETIWYLLKQLFEKGYLYKGYTIQPYSPAAGTGLSSHELNQPGCYRDVKDTSVIAQFLLTENQQKIKLFGDKKVFALAWTTTPWTLPSNTALTIGGKINYALVKTVNPYVNEKINVLIAEDLLPKYFELVDKLSSEKTKKLQGIVLQKIKGIELIGLQYQQLMPFATPYETPENAFQIISGDFVTTSDGTGIVHTAPTFGADDARVAKLAGVPPMLVKNQQDELIPLVDKKGKFIEGLGFLSNKYVKNEFYTQTPPEKSVDVEIAIYLKEKGLAFKVEKYVHSYPHCWRTDKPVLYYPLESWFVKTTAVKQKLIANNQKINWKPKTTGEGRFGHWLQNLVDWNLSRSRYWGTPLPIWRTEDGKQSKCIGSISELSKEIDKSIEAGFMVKNPCTNANFDLHRPFIDHITLASEDGLRMHREPDLIDVWFDSGAMPYAQWHYPFDNKEKIKKNIAFPADFIAEGVDQTRGWFFTLHAISTLLFDQVAFKNVIANGLVLDKNGNKMSKRLGNAVDPFQTIEKYGADAVRWYMVNNSPPWDNLKFDLKGVEETLRKLFGTLHNTYSFFELYANIDGFDHSAKHISKKNRDTLDQWILSLLNTLIEEVMVHMENYDITNSTRAIQKFVIDDLSNWYIRLSRRKFWKGEFGDEKIAAFQTLHECLEKVCMLMSSFSPFYSDYLYMALTRNKNSVHLQNFPKCQLDIINKDLETKMALAQIYSSMVLGIRKKEKIKVRQPLAKIMIPVADKKTKELLLDVEGIIRAETNTKEVQVVDFQEAIFEQIAKPNFKKLGPKVGKNMKFVAQKIQEWEREDINKFNKEGKASVQLGDEEIEISSDDVEIVVKDIHGWKTESTGSNTVALDIHITENLRKEGDAREFVNKIQNLRKEIGLDVTDKIDIKFDTNESLALAINEFIDYISLEVLANSISQSFHKIESIELEVNGQSINVDIQKNK